MIQKFDFDFKSEVVSITQNPFAFYQEVWLLEALVNKTEFQIEHSSKNNVIQFNHDKFHEWRFYFVKDIERPY